MPKHLDTVETEQWKARVNYGCSIFIVIWLIVLASAFGFAAGLVWVLS